MIVTSLLVAGVLFLAWANGANDNFKGVATLYGSGTTTFRQALVWSTTATVAGSLVSVVFAASLVKSFGGKGLIADAFLSPRLLAAVAASAAITIVLATLLGMPTSTTHALTGALVGTGLAAAGAAGIGWQVLLTKFAQPLLLSPIMAIGLTAVLYFGLRALRLRLGVGKETCLCVGEDHLARCPSHAGSPRTQRAGEAAAMVGTAPSEVNLPLNVQVASAEECGERYRGRVLGFSAQSTVDAMHYLSAGAVCFARAVNDTPKIAALLFGAMAFGGKLTGGTLAVVATAMALGGWLHSRRVAETMSKHITRLNTGQGLTANLMTAALVLGASRVGVPVSTTHVSCGAIFGIGLVNGERDWKTIRQILATWLSTLPLGLVLGYLIYQILGT